MKYLEVTQEDIDEAVTYRSQIGPNERALTCPVAQAMKRAGVKKPTAGYYALFEDGERIARAPMSMKKFMVRFDNGKPVQPHRFRLVKP